MGASRLQFVGCISRTRPSGAGALPAMSERRPAPTAWRPARSAVLACLGLALCAVHSPAAWSATSSPSVSPASIKQGDTFTVNPNGFSVDNATGTKALIWGSGPYLEASPANPTGRAHDVAVDTVSVNSQPHTYAYLADGEPTQGANGSVQGGVQIFDVTTVGSPSKVGAYFTAGPAMAVAVSGQRLFVAEGVGGLEIVNVANPAASARVRQLNMPAPVNDVAVDPSGNYAYVALDGDQGLQVVDLGTLNNTDVKIDAR